MSFISKDHFNMALKGIRRLLNQKADKSEVTVSDWSQNDETKMDYIKNRTHWSNFTHKECKPLYIGQTSADATEKISYPDGTNPFHDMIRTSDTFLIEFNNIKYVYQLTGQGMGNANLMDTSYPDTGEPFYIDWYGLYEIKVYTRQPNTQYTLRIFEQFQDIHQLDEKYIPDAILRTSDMSNIFYGTCSTYSYTAKKEATVSNNISPFVLKRGVQICIRFYNDNTVTPITLNVNSTGDKYVKLLNSTGNLNYFWQANCYVTFLYDGSYWNIISVSPSKASTSHYGVTKLSSSVSSGSNQTAATSAAVKSAYDLANAALPKSGGTLTGDLTLKGDPTLNLHAATKRYVDNAVKNVNIPEQVNADWNQTDETAVDFIKNKPTELDALALAVEVGFIDEPAIADDGSIYTDENGAIYML